MLALHLVVLVATLSPCFLRLVHAHGYITSPGSRAYQCSQHSAPNCGAIQYEPQSVEALKGLPFLRNGDAHLCSAGIGRFSELDRQRPGVWPLNNASGVDSFSWTFTAQHATTDFKYYITKAAWHSAKTVGLTADDFDPHPFLVVDMRGSVPPTTMRHDLVRGMPHRSGYHVVYAVWTVDNTQNAFYQCVDLHFDATNTTNPNANASTTTTSTIPKHHKCRFNKHHRRAPSTSMLAARANYRRTLPPRPRPS